MNQNVLIVDDSLTVRMDLTETFEAAGFQLRLCGSAAEARAAMAAELVSVVLLDVLLPDADGVDLLREIRASPSFSTPRFSCCRARPTSRIACGGCGTAPTTTSESRTTPTMSSHAPVR